MRSYFVILLNESHNSWQACLVRITKQMGGWGKRIYGARNCCLLFLVAWSGSEMCVAVPDAMIDDKTQPLLHLLNLFCSLILHLLLILEQCFPSDCWSSTSTEQIYLGRKEELTKNCWFESRIQIRPIILTSMKSLHHYRP